MTNGKEDVAAKVAERMGWVSAADLAEAESIRDALATRGIQKPLLGIAVERGALSAERRLEAERLAEVAREIARPEAVPAPAPASPPAPVPAPKDAATPPSQPPPAAVPPPSPAPKPVSFAPLGPPPKAAPAAPPAPPPTPAFLRIAPTESEAVREIRIAGERLLIGRAPDCGLVLSSTKVSARHAEIAWRDGRWWVRDLGSVNGIRLNGKPAQASPLAAGDEIRIFPYRILFSPPPGKDFSAPPAPVVTEPPPPPVAAPAAEAAPPPAAPASPAAPPPPSPPAPSLPPALEGSDLLRLVFREEGSVRRHIDLDRFPASIGSGEGNAVVLRHADIAPVEAEIRRKDGKFLLAPKPGGIVRLKGELLKDDRSLQAGDTIEMGPFRLECQGKGLPLPPSPPPHRGPPPPSVPFTAGPDWKFLIGIPLACAAILLLTLLIVIWLKSRQRQEMRPQPPRATRSEKSLGAFPARPLSRSVALLLESSAALGYKPTFRKA